MHQEIGPPKRGLVPCLLPDRGERVRHPFGQRVHARAVYVAPNRLEGGRPGRHRRRGKDRLAEWRGLRWLGQSAGSRPHCASRTLVAVTGLSKQVWWNGDAVTLRHIAAAQASQREVSARGKIPGRDSGRHPPGVEACVLGGRRHIREQLRVARGAVAGQDHAERPTATSWTPTAEPRPLRSGQPPETNQAWRQGLGSRNGDPRGISSLGAVPSALRLGHRIRRWFGVVNKPSISALHRNMPGTAWHSVRVAIVSGTVWVGRACLCVMV
jgi:hypothetical protein